VTVAVVVFAGVVSVCVVVFAGVVTVWVVVFDGVVAVAVAVGVVTVFVSVRAGAVCVRVAALPVGAVSVPLASWVAAPPPPQPASVSSTTMASLFMTVADATDHLPREPHPFGMRRLVCGVEKICAKPN
jgi:hypothetical protein